MPPVTLSLANLYPNGNLPILLKLSLYPFIIIIAHAFYFKLTHYPNPPYSIKHKFLIRCYQLGKPFALLLPLTTLETRTRQQLFNKYGVEIILFDKRIDFHQPSGKESKNWFATAWFTWGLSIGKQLTFTSLIEAKQKTLGLI